MLLLGGIILSVCFLWLIYGYCLTWFFHEVLKNPTLIFGTPSPLVYIRTLLRCPPHSLWCVRIFFFANHPLHHHLTHNAFKSNFWKCYHTLNQSKNNRKNIVSCLKYNGYKENTSNFLRLLCTCSGNFWHCS